MSFLVLSYLMKTFAFVRNNTSKTYDWILHRYRKHDTLIEMSKFLGLAGLLVFCVFIYLFFVNSSSTRGYFLRQETQKLNAVTFQYEILNTKILDYKQKNRDSVHGLDFNREVVDIRAEVVKIPWNIELTMNNGNNQEIKQN